MNLIHWVVVSKAYLLEAYIMVRCHCWDAAWSARRCSVSSCKKLLFQWHVLLDKLRSLVQVSRCLKARRHTWMLCLPCLSCARDLMRRRLLVVALTTCMSVC